jgi:hypothetical protein
VMRKCLLAAVAAALAATLIPVANGYGYGWRVVKSKTARADYALTTVSASNIRRPRGLAVRGSGGGDVSVYALVTCSRGFNVGSWSRDFGRGFHRLPMMRRAETCDVVVSGSGEGYIRVQILRR